MKLYLTTNGVVVEEERGYFQLPDVSWDTLLGADSLVEELPALIGRSGRRVSAEAVAAEALRAPIGSQEVWAAGVTYRRSRQARQEEARDAGGGDFYQKVYAAERPELFFKAAGHRVVGPGAPVRIRGDSAWNVPEPELTLALNRRGGVVGYTIGNDMSSRDIEGANPLYLPQAKVYDGSAALGPCLLVAPEPLDRGTAIRMAVDRRGREVFRGETDLSQMKRSFEDLASYLFRECSFPVGCYLMTGTGIVPPSEFTLQSGDRIVIEVPPIGELRNPVL